MRGERYYKWKTPRATLYSSTKIRYDQNMRPYVLGTLPESATRYRVYGFIVNCHTCGAVAFVKNRMSKKGLYLCFRCSTCSSTCGPNFDRPKG